MSLFFRNNQTCLSWQKLVLGDQVEYWGCEDPGGIQELRWASHNPSHRSISSNKLLDWLTVHSKAQLHSDGKNQHGWLENPSKYECMREYSTLFKCIKTSCEKFSIPVTICSAWVAPSLANTKRILIVWNCFSSWTSNTMFLDFLFRISEIGFDCTFASVIEGKLPPYLINGEEN